LQIREVTHRVDATKRRDVVTDKVRNVVTCEDVRGAQHRIERRPRAARRYFAVSRWCSEPTAGNVHRFTLTRR
jgi:hypothetical protein